MAVDHGCRGAPLNRAWRVASISGVSEANRRRTSSGSWSHATDTENSPSEAVLVETVPDSVPPFRETLVFPAVFLEIRIPPSPFGEEGRSEQALFPGLLEKRVIVSLRDFAETLLMSCRPRAGLKNSPVNGTCATVFRSVSRERARASR